MLFIILFNAELKFASEQIYFIFVHIDYGRSEQACLWIMNKICQTVFKCGSGLGSKARALIF